MKTFVMKSVVKTCAIESASIERRHLGAIMGTFHQDITVYRHERVL